MERNSPLTRSLMATTQPFNVANISEWQPLSFGLAVGKYFLALLLVIFLAHVFFPRKYRLMRLAMLFVRGLRSLRPYPVHADFLDDLVPIVAAFLARWMPSYDPIRTNTP